MASPGKKRMRWLIKRPWLSPMIAMKISAILIQKHMRGFIVRHTTHIYGKLEDLPEHDRLGFTSWKQHWESNLEHLPPLLQAPDEQKPGFFIYEIAAREIQYIWRKSRAHLRSSNIRSIRRRSAIAIQRSWRRQRDRREFRALLELVRFSNRGDPRELLRSINPSEALVFEKCSRIQVRFRLGGSTFPPSIFYKIYTNGAVCDIGSFAPRQYRHHRSMETGGQHNKCVHEWKNEICTRCMHLLDGSNVKPETDGSGLRALITVGESRFEARLSEPAVRDYLTGADGWYDRNDSNQWRLVTPQALDPTQEAPGDQQVEKGKPSRFHHSRVRRVNDKRLRMKLRRREWMRKLYASRAESAEESDGMEGKDDEEDLLSWTQGLDYEEYMLQWAELGTSNLC